MSKKRPSNPAVGIYMMKNQKNASALRSREHMCACQRSHNCYKYSLDNEVKNKEYIYLKHICYTNFRPFVQIDLKLAKVYRISYTVNTKF